MFSHRVRTPMLALFILAVLLALVALGWSVFGSRAEQPEYRVLRAEGAFELREYPAMIVAEVKVRGAREEAITQGFRLLAGYIFGGNDAQQNLPMTAPVTQQPGETIAMTAPVTQQADADGAWRVRFIMPAGSTLQTLPTPRDARVVLMPIRVQRYAAMRFSGIPTSARLKKAELALQHFVQRTHLQAMDAPTYAFYNPPWTLPFMRRNEILIPIAME